MQLNLLQTLSNAKIYLTIINLLILIALCPNLSSQQSIISKSSTIEATCLYSYTSNVYTCDFFVSVPVNSTDVLDITGTHLANHTDDDVEAVSHGTTVVAYFNGEVMRKFVNLKRISIFGTELLEISPSAFDVCAKLESLTISYGELTSFPAGMLKNCENLIYFEIMSTNVETFPEDFFGNTKNLEQFVVSVNRLTLLPEKLLQNMEKLKYIRIGNNKIRELSSNFFINAPNLELFSANNNEFQDQADITFALNGKINLKYLWIEDNNFTKFDFRFFAQFQKLEYLSVGVRNGPKLTGIHWQSLPVLLKELKVNGIGENIPGNAFDRIANLSTLILYGKDITNLHKDTFKPLTSLTSLYIYESSIKTLHSELFISQINLSHLLIRNSQIEELPAGLFVPLVNIGIRNVFNGIEINSNKIRRLNANSFGEHPHLQHIDFSYNEINEIERGTFRKFNPYIVYAGFSNNECVNENFVNVNLDNLKKLELCYKNWEEIDPNNTTIAPTSTTPAGSGNNFKKFEVFMMIFVGLLMKFVK